MTNDVVSVGILGTGISLPDRVLTNTDLEKMVDTSDEWIVKRTGISERRILDKDIPAYTLGLKAAERAIEDAGIKTEEIGLIITATVTPDYLTPCMSNIIQDKLGAVNAAAFDVNAACSGFLYGIAVAKQFIANGSYKYALVIGCECLSRVVDWKDRNTCVLFADGAGAAVVGPVEDGYGILATDIGTDGSLGRNITLPCLYMNENDREKRLHENKRVLWMDGSEVFKFAVKVIEQETKKVLKNACLSLDEIKLIVPHQANIRIIDGAARRLGISSDKIYANIHKYGNISAASIPVALEEVVKSGMINKGDHILLVAFGGGLTWAAAVVRWNR